MGPRALLSVVRAIALCAGGAVVNGAVTITGSKVKMRGRGILDATTYPSAPAGAHNLISAYQASDVSIEGIIAKDRWTWNVRLMQSSNVVFQNFKLIGSRTIYNDGIDICNSRDVLIEDSFIRSGDDCIATKGGDDTPKRGGQGSLLPVKNITVTADDRCKLGRIDVGGPDPDHYVRDIRFENILRFGETTTANSPEVRIAGAACNVAFADLQPLLMNATREQAHVNSLGMEFVPAGTSNVLVSRWETQVKDFAAFVKATGYDAFSESTDGKRPFTLEADATNASGYDWKQAGGSWHAQRQVDMRSRMRGIGDPRIRFDDFGFRCVLAREETTPSERRELPESKPAARRERIQYFPPMSWPSSPPPDCPFEPSEDIVAIRFTGVHSDYRVADTWYPTWAADGNLYSVNIPSKFISPDGTKAWLCYSANFAANRNNKKIVSNPPGSRYGLVFQEIQFLDPTAKQALEHKASTTLNE